MFGPFNQDDFISFGSVSRGQLIEWLGFWKRGGFITNGATRSRLFRSDNQLLLNVDVAHSTMELLPSNSFFEIVNGCTVQGYVEFNLTQILLHILICREKQITIAFFLPISFSSFR